MKPRSEPRVIPQTRRYFSVTLEDGQVFDLRFPSYGQASAMVGLFDGMQAADGMAAVSALSGMLDVAGYAIGLCWCHRHFDLESGTPPPIKGDTWRRYGDDVIDELQEHGLTLRDMVALQTAIVTEFGSQIAGVKEARVLGEALPATTGA